MSCFLTLVVMSIDRILGESNTFDIAHLMHFSSHIVALGDIKRLLNHLRL